MIISVNRSGSFKDSLGYVLHDKGAKTVERVGEVQTANLVSDPYQAHHEMQTMADAGRAREQDGKRAGASGSKSEKPAYHFSLSWHVDDQPSRAHMFETGRNALKLLGLDKHQAVMVQHLDTPTHAHLHVVVSLVDPETGRAKGMYRDGYRLDRFAHQYEKDHAMTRTWNRASKYDREHEWKKKPDQEADKKAQAALYEKRKRELGEKQEAEKAALEEKQSARRRALDDRFNEIQKAIRLEKAALQEEHDKQLRDYWGKSEPKPKLETRPGAEQLRPVQSMNAETMRTMKDMERTAPHLHPTNVERPEQPREVEKEPPPRARDDFESRSEQDAEERRYGEEAIKRWQQSQMDRVNDRFDQAIDKLREEWEIESRLSALEWREFTEKCDRETSILDREFGVPDRILQVNQQVEDATPEQTGPVDVRSYVDDYIAGRGRDSREHEQFAANHGSEIEQEFQARKAEQEHQPEPPSSEPPPLEPDPPSYEREPSHYDDREPERHDSEPQQEHDWEYGD